MRRPPPTFQSAPAIAGGRCAPHHGLVGQPVGFNPRPPLLAGDAAPAAGPAGRSPCFNPRPPLLAGDAGPWSWCLHLGLVSIRARHCWRAMRTTPAGAWRGRRFQSAPAIAGGRCLRHGQGLALYRGFNPRPPLLAGDAPGCACCAAAHSGFNPRPPLLAGDASNTNASVVELVVSIRARHCWRAMPYVGSREAGKQTFQSAPAIAGGRCQIGTTGPTLVQMFQSAPAIAGGRCLMT